MFKRISAELLLSAAAGSVGAQQQIYKCITKAWTEYQSTPCADSAPAKAWNAEVAPKSDAAVANERRIDAMRKLARIPYG